MGRWKPRAPNTTLRSAKRTAASASLPPRRPIIVSPWIPTLASTKPPSPGEVDEVVELAETNARVVAQAHAGLGDLVGPLLLAAQDIEAFREAVVVVAKQQRVFAMGEDIPVGG